MIKKSTLLLLLTGMISSCNLFPQAEKNNLSFDINDLKSEEVKKYNLKGNAYTIKIALSGNITDSTTIHWGSLDSAGGLYPYQRFVLQPGKVNYHYRGDFYGQAFYLQHSPFENSAIGGELKADVIVYTTGS